MGAGGVSATSRKAGPGRLATRSSVRRNAVAMANVATSTQGARASWGGKVMPVTSPTASRKQATPCAPTKALAAVRTAHASVTRGGKGDFVRKRLFARGISATATVRAMRHLGWTSAAVTQDTPGTSAKTCFFAHGAGVRGTATVTWSSSDVSVMSGTAERNALLSTIAPSTNAAAMADAMPSSSAAPATLVLQVSTVPSNSSAHSTTARAMAAAMYSCRNACVS